MRSCSIGALVPSGSWFGKVIGSFSKAVSILLPDGIMVSLVGMNEHMEAFAINLEGQWEPFRDRLDRNDKVLIAFSEGTIRATMALDAAEPTITAIELKDAEVWDPRPLLASASNSMRINVRVEPGIGIPAVKAIDSAIEAIYAKGRQKEGIHGSGVFAKEFERLCAASAFPSNLVGFGPGTTPAGDDWLAGYLTAADLLAGGPGTALPRLRQTIKSSLSRTTIGGRTLLAGAIEGIPPQFLVHVALAYTEYIGAAGNLETVADRIREAVYSAFEHGASSGEDSLAGFKAGLFCFP